MFLQMDAFFDRFYSYKSSRFLKNLFLINTCPLDVRVSSCSRCKVSLREHSGCYPGSIQAFWGTISGSKSYLDTIWRYPNFGFKAAEETGVIRRNPRLLFLCRDLLSYSFLCDLDLIQTATSSLNPSLWFSECKPLIQRFFQMLRDLPLHPRLYCDHYRRPEERHYENVLSFLFAIFIVISGANNG